jgi:hypothetical protein
MKQIFLVVGQFFAEDQTADRITGTSQSTHGITPRFRCYAMMIERPNEIWSSAKSSRL